MPYHLVGVSHRTADVSVRERLALSTDDILRRLMVERGAGRSLVVLCTCNRLELYWWGEHDQEARLQALAAERELALQPSTIYRLDGPAALRHLFAVAAGIDSQIFGEVEILGQVRRAHDAAREAGTTTPELDFAFTAAVAAGRRARRETALGRHPGSISEAALQHAKRSFDGSLAERRVLIVGAGEVAESLLRALAAEPVAGVTLVGRSEQRAAELAKSVPRARATPLGWEGLPAALGGADVVVAATSSRRPVLAVDQVAAAVAVRPDASIVVLDLAVPRNVDPAARDVPGVRLYDLDDLQLQHCPAVGGGSAAMDEIDRVLDEELARFRRQLRHRAAAPRLAELHRLGAELAREEAERALAQLGTVSERDREVVRRMAERLAKRVLYPASRRIREG